MSKGDTPRPVDKEKYDANYERVFGKREVKTWTDAPRVAEGSGADGRSGDELLEEPDERPSPEAPETVEGTESNPARPDRWECLYCGHRCLEVPCEECGYGE